MQTCLIAAQVHLNSSFNKAFPNLNNIADISNGNWNLKIDDTGSGIPRSKIKNIFDPFYTTRAGGTGLGLSVVRHFAEVMGEEVGMRSAKPHGAIFWCSLSL